MTSLGHQITGWVGSARRWRLAMVLVACFALCSLAVLSATHLHGHQDGDTRDHGALTCLICAAVPVGAPPPPVSAVSASVQCVLRSLVPAVNAPPPAAPAFSYLSRGPPVA